MRPRNVDNSKLPLFCQNMRKGYFGRRALSMLDREKWLEDFNKTKEFNCKKFNRHKDKIGL